MLHRNRFGFIAATSTGGGGGAELPFSDIDILLADDSDPTKQAKFELSGITTGTTRTYTLPNADGTLALTSHNHDTVYAPVLGADDNYVTDAEKVKLSNLSGTNTGDQNTFLNIAVSGQSSIVADTGTDTLTIAAGSGISLTTDASTDTLTITATGGSSGILPAVNLERQVILFEDFIVGSNADSRFSGYTNTVAGGMALGSIDTTLDSKEFVGYMMYTSTANTNTCSGYFTNSGKFNIGAGEMYLLASVAFEAVSDGTNRYEFFFGLSSAGGTITSEPANGIYFWYDDASSNFRIKCANASSVTNTDSGVTLAANTAYQLIIKVNSAGNSVEFFINGTSVGTVNTNVPSTTTDLNDISWIRRTVGTTSRKFYYDKVVIIKDYTTGRSNL